MITEETARSVDFQKNRKVDLSTLKAGDGVRFRSDETALVNWIAKNDYGGFKIYFFSDAINQPINFNDDYYQSGIIQFSDEMDNDIVEIIKNPLCWTDDDMKKAAISGHRDSIYDKESADSWLKKYIKQK